MTPADHGILAARDDDRRAKDSDGIDLPTCECRACDIGFAERIYHCPACGARTVTAPERFDHRPIWVVRDPSECSCLVDILYRTTLAELPRYIIGAGLDRWESEHHTIHDNKREAILDADRRLLATLVTA